MNPLEDPVELGRRIQAARGYAGMKRPAFWEAMGSSEATVIRWEKGNEASLGRTLEERRQLAERIQRVTGCPAEWLGLEEAEPSIEERLSRVEQLLESGYTIAPGATSPVEDEGDPSVEMAMDLEREEGQDADEGERRHG